MLPLFNAMLCLIVMFHLVDMLHLLLLDLTHFLLMYLLFQNLLLQFLAVDPLLLQVLVVGKAIEELVHGRICAHVLLLDSRGLEALQLQLHLLQPLHFIDLRLHALLRQLIVLDGGWVEQRRLLSRPRQILEATMPLLTEWINHSPSGLVYEFLSQIISCNLIELTALPINFIGLVNILQVSAFFRQFLLLLNVFLDSFLFHLESQEVLIH